MTVGDRIKAFRKDRGLTQEDIAKAVGTSKQTVFKYESNIIVNIPLEKVEGIAGVLRVSPAQLMGWEASAPSKEAGPRARAHTMLDELPAEKLRDVINYMRFLASATATE